MKIFVSYTLRDKQVSVAMLEQIAISLGTFSTPYIDILHNNSIDKQERVIDELITSDFVLIVLSENTFRSEWVQLEVDIAVKLDIPIFSIYHKALEANGFEILYNLVFRNNITIDKTIACGCLA